MTPLAQLREAAALVLTFVLTLALLMPLGCVLRSGELPQFFPL